MSIANLKKLASAFNVPHAEHTTAGHECLHCVCEAARKELEALVKAAQTIDRWGIGDVMGLDNEAEWDAALRAKDEAQTLMDNIAKESA